MPEGGCPRSAELGWDPRVASPDPQRECCSPSPPGRRGGPPRAACSPGAVPPPGQQLPAQAPERCGWQRVGPSAWASRRSRRLFSVLLVSLLGVTSESDCSGLAFRPDTRRGALMFVAPIRRLGPTWWVSASEVTRDTDTMGHTLGGSGATWQASPEPPTQALPSGGPGSRTEAAAPLPVALAGPQTTPGPSWPRSDWPWYWRWVLTKAFKVTG